MENNKTAILLMNVGSPDAPTKPAVRRFLTEFLNDKRVIDLPWLLRKFLVNLIIIPFRLTNSTGLYKRLWTEKGSALIYISEELKEKLQLKLGADFEVFVGMRYGNPNYKKALAEIKKSGFKKMVVIPLYPQHAMSTTETSFLAVDEEIKKQKIQIEQIKIGQFYQCPDFVKAFAKQAQKYKPESFDHILFSYHGLPVRQDAKSKPEGIPDYSYSKACCETTQLIAKELKLADSDYTIGFQSRLSKNWLTPFSDQIIMQKLNEGKKRILVLAPAFVTDCLETIVEIEFEYAEDFIKEGGEKLQLVSSLNAEDSWVETLVNVVQESLK
ncbi:ferrochelatase [Prolixibacteraceae bacterium Z1-6]|uniref:Ferrochelatase n=1 Tax=Draconibacterium aestuarii TaxID=2998507 RepID=A0A9X3J5U3_9BACT|nr:ferrochelatase [Prolixibacteraceae bacterium Z1-6]